MKDAMPQVRTGGFLRIAFTAIQNRLFGLDTVSSHKFPNILYERLDFFLGHRLLRWIRIAQMRRPITRTKAALRHVWLRAL
jgi:hypothetical protein